METAIRSTIGTYIKCISERNINGLNELLNPHFRVTQVMPDTFETVNLTRAQYLQLFADKKAGGDEYTIENLLIEHIGPTATASYTLSGKETQMHVFLQLTQSSAHTWKILGNMPMVTACPH